MQMQRSTIHRDSLARGASRVHVSRAVVQGMQRLHSRSRRSIAVRAEFAPPTVSETKRKFIEGYRKPVASIYNTVLQELLVQQHFIRWNVKYQYNEVFALGFVSVFDQVLDGFNDAEKAKVFEAYVSSLDEDAAQYRADAADLEALARQLPGPDGLVPDAAGNKLQVALSKVAEATASGNFNYNKFFAVGLFRLLELTGAKEPAALARLVTSVGVSPEAVNKDLLMYKGILSKLSAAKELMREFLEREKKKAAEREAGKAAQAEPGALVAEDVTRPSGDGASATVEV